MRANATRRAQDLIIAPMSRRLLASLIDLAAGVGVIASIPLGLVALAKLGVFRRLSGSRIAKATGERVEKQLVPPGGLLAGAAAAHAAGRDQPTRSPKAFRLALALLGLRSSVRHRNRRSPGYRLLGLRRVDLRTGGPVGIRSAIVRIAVTRARAALVSRLSAPVRRRGEVQRRELAPELEKLIRRHRDDPTETRQRAIADFYRERNVTPFAPLARLVLPGLAATCASEMIALWSPLRQGLTDRLAGTVVIVER